MRSNTKLIQAVELSTNLAKIKRQVSYRKRHAENGSEHSYQLCLTAWVANYQYKLKLNPYKNGEINSLKEEFDTYIKTVIDIEKRICSAGCDRYFESEKILLEQGSIQLNLWGGGIDLETKIIDFNSFINIRPSDSNTSNEIQDNRIRDGYEELSRYFFKEIYG